MGKYIVTSLFDNSELVVEAITFEELVKHGLENGANVVNGMPWSWNYMGQPITHENDECYIVPEGMSMGGHSKMTPNDMLVTNVLGQMYVMAKDLFYISHATVSDKMVTKTKLLDFKQAMDALANRTYHRFDGPAGYTENKLIEDLKNSFYYLSYNNTINTGIYLVEDHSLRKFSILTVMNDLG